MCITNDTFSVVQYKNGLHNSQGHSWRRSRDHASGTRVGGLWENVGGTPVDGTGLYPGRRVRRWPAVLPRPRRRHSSWKAGRFCPILLDLLYLGGKGSLHGGPIRIAWLAWQRGRKSSLESMCAGGDWPRLLKMQLVLFGKCKEKHFICITNENGISFLLDLRRTGTSPQ